VINTADFTGKDGLKHGELLTSNCNIEISNFISSNILT
jgi:hypothetical protein